MTSLKSLETFLPTELLKDLEALAVEEGRDVEAVVAAAVRRYLWDSTFRTLRRHAQARSRVQGWVSDQSILTTVLALRRPDEFSLTKTEGSLDAVAAEGAEGGVAEATMPASPSSTRTREPREFRERKERRERREPREAPRALREPRERPVEMETARRFERSLPSPEVDEAPGREDSEESGGRRPRRRGRISRREDVADVRASSSPDMSEPGATPATRTPARTAAPSYAVNTPNVDLAAIRRRAESVHRFLPPDPSEREHLAEPRENRASPENRENPGTSGNRESENREASGNRESAPRAAASRGPRERGESETIPGSPSEEPAGRQPSTNPSWSLPSRSSSVSASDSPASRPDSPAAPNPTPPPSSASFGRKPKRSSGRR